MEDHNYKEAEGKLLDLRKVLPFMAEFPFPDYEITVVEKGSSFVSLGISPILINAFGDTGTSAIVNFDYPESDSNVTISIYKDDIEWIAQESNKIKKMDKLRLLLDLSLESDNLIEKIKAIRVGKKFIRLLDCENFTEFDVGDVISDFILIYETVLPSKVKLALQKLSESALKSTEFSEKQFKVATAFLNFQIHYIKILLGIVIAAKIY